MPRPRPARAAARGHQRFRCEHIITTMQGFSGHGARKGRARMPKRCPRCGGTVLYAADEPSCLACGWAGPSRPPDEDEAQPRRRGGPTPAGRRGDGVAEVRRKLLGALSPGEECSARDLRERLWAGDASTSASTIGDAIAACCAPAASRNAPTGARRGSVSTASRATSPRATRRKRRDAGSVKRPRDKKGAHLIYVVNASICVCFAKNGILRSSATSVYYTHTGARAAQGNGGEGSVARVRDGGVASGIRTHTV